jgi:hypothetical protein
MKTALLDLRNRILRVETDGESLDDKLGESMAAS